jgi:hypothetical protein
MTARRPKARFEILVGSSSDDARRVGAQGAGVVLFDVPAGQLENTLGHQVLQGVADPGGILAPLLETGGEGGAGPQLAIGLDTPGQAAIRGQHLAVEGPCGLMGHERAPQRFGLV